MHMGEHEPHDLTNDLHTTEVFVFYLNVPFFFFLPSLQSWQLTAHSCSPWSPGSVTLKAGTQQKMWSALGPWRKKTSELEYGSKCLSVNTLTGFPVDMTPFRNRGGHAGGGYVKADTEVQQWSCYKGSRCLTAAGLKFACNCVQLGADTQKQGELRFPLIHNRSVQPWSYMPLCLLNL